MTREIISAALDAEGFKSGTHGYAIPEDREATCLVAGPGELLTVSRVTGVELRQECVVLRTAKDERFYFGYDSVLGLRVLGKAQAKERSAGFAR